MEPFEIEGATRVLFAPKDWNEHRDGPCRGLPIRESKVEGSGLPIMVSAWKPTDAEMIRLISGAPIELGVLGTSHPPVSMSVGAAPRLGELTDVDRARIRVKIILDTVEQSEQISDADVAWLLQFAAAVTAR